MHKLEQMVQAEQQRLYEISSLTDEMHDGDAQVLLEWASAQLPLMIDSVSDVEDKAKAQRQLVRTMSNYVGNVEDMGEDQRQVELQRVYQAASELNYPAQDNLMPALVQQFDGLKSGDVLTILIAWLEDDSLLTDELSGDNS